MTIEQPVIQTQDSSRWSKQQWTLLVLLFSLIAGVVYFYNLGEERTISSHEGFAIIPAGEMLKSGDWVVPMFGGLPRLQKPPLPYWTVAVSSLLWGETEQINLAAARLPAAISAVLLTIFMGYWAFRWYGKSAAIGTLFVQLTSLYMIMYGRKAEVDMLNFLLMTVAMFLIIESSPSDSQKVYHARWIGIFALLSLSWLAKFHYGLAMVIAPCGLYYLVQKRYKEVINFFHPIGLMLLVAAVTIWPHLVTQRLPEAWEVWNSELIVRATGTLDGLQFPIWFYLPLLFWLTLPWTPLALSAIPHSAWRAWKRKDAHERFLWIWFLVQLAIVTIQPNKHKHYIMAALPVFSLWSGQAFARIVAHVRDGKPFLNKQWACCWATVIIAGPTIAAILSIKSWPFLINPILVVSIIPILLGLIALWLFYQNRFTWGGSFALIALLVLYIGTIGWIIPGRDHRLPVVYFMQEIRSSLPAEENICIFRIGQDPMIYYLQQPAFRAEDEKLLQKELDKQQRVFVVTQKGYLEQLSQMGEVHILKTLTTPPNCPPPQYIIHKRLLLAELTTFQYAQKNRSPSRRTLQAVNRKTTTNNQRK